MDINYTQTSEFKLFNLFNLNKTKTKKESAENFLSFQRKNLKSGNKSGNTYKNGMTTRTYDNQDSINQSLFEYSDKNKDGKIDTDEYKQFIMESVSDGTVGQKEYRVVSRITSDGKVVSFNSPIYTADYNNLIEIMNMYSGLLKADTNIDKNNDGILSQDEFNESAALKLTTGSNEEVENILSFGDSKSYNEKYRTVSLHSNGIVGNISTTYSVQYAFNILSNQYEMLYTPEMQLSSDYDKLIAIGDEYYDKLKD